MSDIEFITRLKAFLHSKIVSNANCKLDVCKFGVAK